MQELKNYRTALKSLVWGFVALAVVAFVIVGGLSWFFYKKAEERTATIWILDPKTGKVMSADQVNEQQNQYRDVEYKAHIKMFYNYWFALDQFNYKANTDAGLQLVGNTGKGLIAKYQQEEMQKKLAEYNMSMSVVVDSIICDMGVTPVKCACFAKQTIKTPGGEYKRYISAQMEMIDQSSRSEVNPHGVLIENFQFFNTNKLEEGNE